MSKVKQRLGVIKSWCEDNDLIFIRWDGTLEDDLYYTSREMSDYTFKRNSKRIIYGGDGVNASLSTELVMMTESSQDRYIIDSLRKNEVSLIAPQSTKLYGEMGNVFDFEVTGGKYAGLKGRAKLSLLISHGFRRTTYTKLNDKCRKRYLNSVAHNRGYRLIKYPCNLNKAEECTLVSPEGSLWSPLWFNFENGARCPYDFRNPQFSYGEMLIMAILNTNDISYTPEFKITHEDGSWQYMDFYIEHNNKKFCVEYHGEHHYQEVEWFKGAGLDDVRRRDKKKSEYCENNDIIYFEIPYTERSLACVHKMLSKLFVLSVIPDDEYVRSLNYSKVVEDHDIVEYFKNHTQKETAHHFGVSTQKVYTACQSVGFKKGSFAPPQRVVGCLGGKEFAFKSMAEAHRETGVDVKSFFKKKDLSKPTKGWIFKKVS